MIRNIIQRNRTCLLRTSLLAKMQYQHQMVRPALLPVVQYRQFAYHDRVIDHYENPRNVGSLSNKDKTVGTGLVGAPACGDVMKL